METMQETAPMLARGANLDERTRPRFLAAGLTDRGRRRPRNEDAVLLRPDLGLFLVADGVSGITGEEGGDVAAQLAVDRIATGVAQAGPDALHEDPESALRGAIENADRYICERGRALGLPEMGTTIAAVLLAGPRAVIAHVGDSRVYRLRGAGLERLTVDHSLAAEWEERNQRPLPAGVRMQIGQVITRALGGKRPGVVVDVRSVPCQAGDLFLLCSDGLHGLLSDDDMIGIITGASDLEEALVQLVRAANDAAGHDNISAILVRMLGA